MANEKRLIYLDHALQAVSENYRSDMPQHDLDMLVATRKRLKAMPTVDAVPLADIYRVIAGHSNYHGDNILSALTCIAEGKEVKPVKPLPTVDAVEVVHGRWEFSHETTVEKYAVVKCSNCGRAAFAIAVYVKEGHYCPNCGAKMDGDSK